MLEKMIRTQSHTEFINIDRMVQQAIAEAGVQDGICCVYVPHTTAAVTINENADPDVRHDLIAELDKVIPWNDHYRHTEGNAAAHIKASLVGNSVMVIIENGQLCLGTWQSLFFCEFDGPRTRKIWLKLLAMQ